MSGPAEIDVSMTLTLDTVIGSEYRRGYRQIGDGEYEETHHEEPFTFLDAIVDRVADQLVAKAIADETRYRGLRGRVSDRLNAAIDARVGPMIEETFTKPIPLTNAYGESSGKTTTLTELVIEKVQSHMVRRTGRSYDQTAFDKALAQVTERVLTDELAAEIKAAKTEIRAAVHKVTGTALSAAIAAELTKS